MDRRAQRDGCGCPPWVECVHCDGQVIWLFNDDLFPGELAPGHWGPGGYSVMWGGQVEPCSCGNPGHVVMARGSRATYGCDVAAAQAEFDRRAEKLRQGASDDP